MTTYLMRSLRFILKMAVILAAVFIVLYFTGHLNTGGKGLIESLFMSWKGAVLLGALLVIAAVYPIWSFGNAYIKGSIKDDRDQIIEALTTMNYTLEKEVDGVMYFRPKSMIKRMILQFDDTIQISGSHNYLTAEGHKKELGRVEMRLNAFINK